MSALFMLIGSGGLLVVATSLGLELRAWSQLDQATKAEQRAIKQADLALHAAERAHKRRVATAEKSVADADNPPRRRKFGQLDLYDDRVRVGGQWYALSAKTKPKVVCRGRGEERSVMLLLEDVNWARSLNATKIGKEHEFEAQKFASDVRVLAPRAVEARARRVAAVTTARREADAIAGDTSELEAARVTRAGLGDRLKAAGPPPGKRWRRAATPAAVAALFFGGVTSAPIEQQQTATAVAQSAETTSTPTPTPTPTPDRGELLDTARSLLAAGNYGGAQDAVADLPSTDRSYIRRLASARAARVVEKALARSDRAAAQRALERARGLPHTPELDAARDNYQAAVATASAARRDREERARVRAAEEAAAAESQRDVDAASADASYAGQSCGEIGHSFEVAPGSDLEHDRDGDGLACESQ